MNKACKTLKKAISGFKGFLYGGRCALNAKYAEKTTYKKPKDEDMQVCTDKGFHFCRKAEDVWAYYPPMQQGLPACYSEVTIPEGATVAESSSFHPKAISNTLCTGRFMSIFNFALGHFRRLKERLVDRIFSVAIVEKRPGLCSGSGLLVVGSASQQAIVTRDNSIGITTETKSAVRSAYLAITSDESSFSSSHQMAIALRGGASSDQLAVGGSYAYAREPGGIALVLKDDGVAAGSLGSLLVFYASGNPHAFQVDGKRVKANTLYILCRGCLCEVKPFKDLTEGSLE